VTYFPLTWRFAANEFGWDYRFNQQEGLVIANDKVKLENPEKWTIPEPKEVAGETGWGSTMRIIPTGIYGCESGSLEKPLVVSKKEIAQDRETLQKYANGRLLSLQELQELEDEASETERSNILQLERLLTARVSILDMIGGQVFSGVDMTYQIYRQIGQQKELVFQYILPPFSGHIGYQNVAYYDFITDYWISPSLATGTYSVRVKATDPFPYYSKYDETKQLQQFSLSEVDFWDRSLDFQIIE